MEVISIERSTYEELLTSFNSFVAQMKAMASRGNDKKLGDWLDNQDVCQILNISPRTLQTLRDNGTLAFSQVSHKVYYKPEDVKKILTVVEDRKKSQCMNLKCDAYERTDHAT
ncbi:MAG: helix-turn-helix domain-containing protein [Prevotella sp.]|nr:helix-turn-helix domain-containing protein [Prevotella sp.]